MFGLIPLVAFLLWSGPQLPPHSRQVDKACNPRGFCTLLLLRRGKVVDFTPNKDPSFDRTVEMGPYAPGAQHLVPKYEAPVSELRTPSGWTMVVSGSVRPEGYAGLNVRFFAPGGKVALTYNGGSEILTMAKLGRLFGGRDEIAAVCTSSPHPNTQDCRLWWLRRGSAPVQVFNLYGRILAFVPEPSAPGVWTRQVTNIFDNPYRQFVETDFWKWNAAKGTLTKSF